MSTPKKRVLMLMSGGVDSSTASGLLLRQGFEVIGLTLKLWKARVKAAVGKPYDLSRSDINDAQLVARKLGITHCIIDLSDSFRKLVVDPFVEEYSRGRTPNPCVFCNELIKFDTLWKIADLIGADSVASGHYARVGRDRVGHYHIRKALDGKRDQSYFLYRLKQNHLRRMIFPLGKMTKEEVRLKAEEMALPVAFKKDSQEVCFVNRFDLASFLTSRIPREKQRRGAIINTAGRILGQHQGIHNYTIGQRRGLGLAVGQPLYVVGIDAGEGTLMVGEDRDLYQRSLIVTDLHWSLQEGIPESERVLVRIRYLHQEEPAGITFEDGKARIDFDQPQRAITPGQSAVFYSGDRVLGGGIIEGPF